ncbi:MAG: HPr family phosphocarrier protein [Elusimicrobia bacterium]|nr:HPr family phosphocarrier protein [Elusimicrobiota bacterium]
MIEQQMIIKNKLGLHARAAAMLVETTSKYSSDVIIRKGDREVDGKSIMGIMTLVAGLGTEITVKANGQDEADAIRAIAELIDRRFDEE